MGTAVGAAGQAVQAAAGVLADHAPLAALAHQHAAVVLADRHRLAVAEREHVRVDVALRGTVQGALGETGSTHALTQAVDRVAALETSFFSERFLIERPLLKAIRATSPVVLPGAPPPAGPRR